MNLRGFDFGPLQAQQLDCNHACKVNQLRIHTCPRQGCYLLLIK